MVTLGVDIGGTKVKVAAVNSDGEILVSRRRSTRVEEGPEAVLSDVLECVKGCLGEAAEKAQALGIGVAGQVDEATGAVRFSPNLGWRNVPLQNRLEQELGFPVIVTNDVRAITWGEWRHGAGKGSDDLICIYVGTGIGGGIVASGRLRSGCSNTAGEIGHMTLVARGRECTCGNRGCWEAYAGGWGIARRAQEAAREHPAEAAFLLKQAGDISGVDAVAVAAAYEAGDALGRRLVEETGVYLAAGVVALVNAFNPCLIVLGGGVVDGLPDLIPQVQSAVQRDALESATARLRIEPARLGARAGVVGAAAYARTRVQEAGTA